MTRAVILVLVAVVLLISGRAFLAGPSLDRAERAYRRGDWRSAAEGAAAWLEAHPGEARATRLEARALAKMGRPSETLALLARLGGDRLEAEDMVLAGRALLDAHQPTLGWSAIESAARLDPKHPGAAEALAGRPREPNRPVGPDRLSAVPSATALAEMIVQLASRTEEPDAGGAAPRHLDRLLRRDRATFSRVDSPASARKLLARLFLEGGETRSARDLIGPIDDPESQWLLSRVELVEGDLPAAQASATRAGSYGRDDPAAVEPSRYVGAARCAECHREIYDAQQSSHHSATIARGEGLKSVPLPEGTVADPGNPAVTHRFERDGAKIRVTASKDAEAIRAYVDYALGSGHHGVTMLAKGDDGRHRSLRLSFYSGGRHWGLTSGFAAMPADPHAYIGEPLNDDSFRNCLNCHSTRFTSEEDRAGPEAADRGIGCERCHGPGDHHVRAVGSGLDWPAIARPRLATPARRLKLCAQCHASDGVIPPADPRFIRFQATTLPYSRCEVESGGRLDCVACHDPHRDVETRPAHYEARCLACHGDGRSARRPAPEIRIEAVAARRCPVDPAGGCISCHMPKVEGIMPFMSFTDHHIRIHRPSTGKAPAEARR